jgi:hypothetical protein
MDWPPQLSPTGGGGVHCQVIRDFPGPGHWSLKIDGQSGVQGADPKGGGGLSWVRTKAEQGRARGEFVSRELTQKGGGGFQLGEDQS